jgi:hypothetical protein
MSDAPAPAQAPALDRLGPRTRRRAEPRLTIALAAAGCALVVLGALVIGGDGLIGDDGDGSRLPGIVASLAVVAAGFAVLASIRSGPLATAGAVASTLGVPPLLFFLTFDEDSFPPYSTEVILIVSTVVWVLAWAVGPGRGRPLYLGAAALGLWLTVLQLTEEVFTFPFGIFGGFESTTTTFSEDPSGGFGFGPELPDPTVIGALSLAFGGAYLWLARRWDRTGHAGSATPLTVAAVVALIAAVPFLSEDLETAGSGLLAMALGTAVAAHGASVGRRGTTWLGAAGAAIGVLLVVTEITDEPTPGGALLILAGSGVVAAAEALRRATDEPDELLVEPADGPVAF